MVPGTGTRIRSRDWRSLSDWYVRLFGCTVVPPQRDYSGPDLERGTAVPSAALQGRICGCRGMAMTARRRRYTFASTEGTSEPAIDRPGFRHIAFAVAGVHTARRCVLDEGGSSVGEVVTLTTSDGRPVTWCYVTDPEGNAVELQSCALPAGSSQ